MSGEWGVGSGEWGVGASFDGYFGLGTQNKKPVGSVLGGRGSEVVGGSNLPRVTSARVHFV